MLFPKIAHATMRGKESFRRPLDLRDRKSTAATAQTNPFAFRSHILLSPRPFISPLDLIPAEPKADHPAGIGPSHNGADCNAFPRGSSIKLSYQAKPAARGPPGLINRHAGARGRRSQGTKRIFAAKGGFRGVFLRQKGGFRGVFLREKLIELGKSAEKETDRGGIDVRDIDGGKNKANRRAQIIARREQIERLAPMQRAKCLLRSYVDVTALAQGERKTYFELAARAAIMPGATQAGENSGIIFAHRRRVFRGIYFCGENYFGYLRGDFSRAGFCP